MTATHRPIGTNKRRQGFAEINQYASHDGSKMARDYTWKSSVKLVIIGLIIGEAEHMLLTKTTLTIIR